MNVPLYDSQRITRNPRVALTFSLVCLLLLLIAASSLIYVPWTQSVFGEGEVGVFDPKDRPQTVDAQLRGRLVRLEVMEGDWVEEGQLMAVLEDRDPRFLDPNQMSSLEAQRAALLQKQLAIRQQISTLDEQNLALIASQNAMIPSAEVQITQSKQKQQALTLQLEVAKQKLETSRLQQERIETLFEAGLRSRRDLELQIQEYVQAQNELLKVEIDHSMAMSDIELADLERDRIAAEVRGRQIQVSEEIAKAHESLADIDNQLARLSIETSTLKSRQQLQEIRAPRTGRVVQLRKVGPGQMLQEGETLAVISPGEQRLGVELYIQGLDSPLVQEGRPVRLIFEGFPAVPFVGWPWTSVGTFGGRVAFVDPIATKEGGKTGFRVWVLPDPNEPRWPYQEKLLIGSRAAGWILLDEVPLYYEIWRQLNAFPARPVLDEKIKSKPVIRR